MLRNIAAIAAMAAVGAVAAGLFGNLAARQAAAQARGGPVDPPGLRATTGRTPYGKRLDKGAHVEKATFGAGCFWGVEAAFRRVKGVTTTRVGYMGGHTKNPSYQDVCAGRTGHAEVVEVTYDPKAVSYSDLLTVFFAEHDPTTVNRQGPDVGYQYRSVIFYHTPEQKQAAEDAKKQLSVEGRFRGPVVTAIEPAPEFWQAEDYHQQYLEKRGLASCHIP